MGKNLRGQEIGVGISQRKDGLYTARFTDKNGRRRQKYFKTLQECRNWLAEAQLQDGHGHVLYSESMTVDAWYQYWIDNVKGNNIRYNTRRGYNDRYEKNIKPLIGDMLLKDVKPLHCQDVLNQMAGVYMNSTIQRTRTLLWVMLDSAVENELLFKNPVTKSVRCKSGKKSKEKRVLTMAEQGVFLQAAKETEYYNQYALILQTGLRIGEMTALKWSDIDFDKKMLHVRRTMEYVYSDKRWRIGEPKSKSGNRDIPLTNEAVSILESQREKMMNLKRISMDFSDFVFLNQDGEPVTRSCYNKELSVLAKRAGVKTFSAHTLRHTFATRCIEAGMKPKTLQTILGHADIGTTMNMYVHITEEERSKEICLIEDALKVI